MSTEELDAHRLRTDMFFEWLYEPFEKLESLDQLPDWFDLKKYEDTKDFTLIEWVEALMIRRELELVAVDGPQFPPDSPQIRFREALFRNPLAPDYSIDNGASPDFEHSKSKIESWLKTGAYDGDASCFSFTTDIPNHMLLRAFEKYLSELRESGLAPKRKKKIDPKIWCKFNLLGIWDLLIWCYINQLNVGWPLLVELADPQGRYDDSVVRKHINAFDQLIGDERAQELALVQWILEE